MEPETCKNDNYKNWPYAILVGIDQLGNAIAGGNPDSTISARVGYFSINLVHKNIFKKQYWNNLERIIDWAFYPIEGPNHCKIAYNSDKDECFRRGSDIARFILGFTIYPCCVVIAIVLRIAVLLKPSWKYKEL